MKKTIIVLMCILFCGCAENITVRETQESVSLSNGVVRLEYDLSRGTYGITSLSDNIAVIEEATGALNEVPVTEALSHSYTLNGFEDRLGKGKELEVRSVYADRPETILGFRVYENEPFVVLSAGIRNTTSEPFVVRSMEPLASARTLEGYASGRPVTLLDGNAGGEASFVYHELPLFCRNNMLVRVGEGKDSKNIVFGGISYNDFEKFVEAKSSNSREKVLAGAFPDAELKAYLNLPVMREAGIEPMLTLGGGHATRFGEAPGYEMQNLVYDWKEIAINIIKTNPTKDYALGLSWVSDNPNRKQSVWADNGPDSEEILLAEAVSLPSFHGGDGPAQVIVNLPPALVKGGDIRIRIKREGKSNVILQEAWLYEGGIPAERSGVWEKVSGPAPSEGITLRMAAQDPVGRRVDPGREYLPEDRFYIDVSTADPFEALELYGNALKKAQRVELQYYDFPSVCLWYAMHHYYGGGPAVNDSPGAVEEMERIAASGFLNYARAAVRLVPDCYEENNEQGWWDDEHFRMYGSGHAVPGEVTVEAHYREPYETTAKWATAVSDLGGIPLLYVQTAKRSQDYAEAFPGHMLFNQSDAYIPDQDWTVLNKASYDFTDPGFTAHMKDVYRNFSEGGLKGLMFDYTNTGWAGYGGLEDPYSTASAAYRRIYGLAREGMGPEAWIHERVLERGSDMTLGLVSSQRIWGDTDDVTPEMVMRGGVRWYKNRVVVSYDMDAKNLLKAKPADHPDGRRKLLTMCYVTSARLLLANSFANIQGDVFTDLTRVFPMHTLPQSARPVDLFTQQYPRIYDFRVNDDWHQLTLYNPDNEHPADISVDLFRPESYEHLNLDPASEYYVYDFWNDRLAGRLSGNGKLSQELRAGEARMLSVRRVKPHAQILSTNRHIMQGLVDLHDIRENDRSVSAQADVVSGDPFVVTVALNGKRIEGLECDGADAVFETEGDLARITIRSPENRKVHWTLKLK